MSDQCILTPFFLDQHSPELESLAQPGWTVNKPTLTDGDLQQRMSVLYEPLADFVARAIRSGNRPISIAGDCCAAIGFSAGLQRAGSSPVLIWCDAHGDFNTWETTPSGFIGGMPLAMLVGRGEQTLLNALRLHPLSESQVILTDGRDLDPEERRALAGSEVCHLTDSLSLLEHLPAARSLYVHLDADLINPQDAPAMSYRAPGGPSAAELQTLFRALAQTGRIIAVSMGTWNPRLDGAGRSQAASMAVLQALIEQ
jgi:arginase